ncbi:MAG TPA: ABC transporter ATP-binding protein [bacterium]
MEPILKLENVHKSFQAHFWTKKKKILKGISLEIYPGEIFGFLGPNGAGKTTTIKIITGLLRPDTGAVTVMGSSIESIDVRQNMGFLPESPYFYDHLTGYEFLKNHALLANCRDYKDKIITLLLKVGLSKSRDVALRKYSRGMLQRIGIAQALISDPKLLVLDEPLTGLDPIGRKEVKDIILEQKNKGTTIFFSSHILPDAEAVCDRIGIIIEGEILKIGSLDKLLKRGTKTDEISLEEWFMQQVQSKPKEATNV